MGWRDGWDASKAYLQEAAQEYVGDRIGVTVVPKDRLEYLEEAAVDRRSLQKELDVIGWTALDHLSSNPHEMRPKKRVEAAKQARMAWMYDPMAGRSTDLVNDFVFGRGVPPPRARDPRVQKVLDQAWKDPDNVAVLTGFAAQMALGTDLSLQCNLFILFFADGKDGKVKLSLLDHDTVFDAVRDPENRLRVLYYVAYHSESTWDFESDQQKPPDVTETLGKKQVRYYPHWKNLQDAKDDAEAGLRDAPPEPPAAKLGDGVVYHIAINRTSEMVFGIPMMQRTLRWFSAYNDLMSARVDMAKAAAELIMKRKVKGSPSQLATLARNAVARGGEIATTPDPTRVGARPASTIYENENVTNEPFKLDSGSANASQDATMIRSQVSAGMGLPQHYLGDQGNANLATATAMDLPVMKMMEGRQEFFEQLFRAFADMTIRRAVEQGILKGDLPDEDDAEVSDVSTIGEAAVATEDENADKAAGVGKGPGKDGKGGGKMDLTYEFKMPNPLRRLMGDLVTAISGIAQTFDPNGTNIELNRTLLAIALGEALEVQDPSDAVERIFPQGYVDPLVAAELAGGSAPSPGQVPPPAPGQQDGPTPAVGGEPGSGREGPYGTKSGATPPEQVQQEALFDDLSARVRVTEARFDDLPGSVQDGSQSRQDDMDAQFDAIVGDIAEEILERIPQLASTNGHVR